jgi:hypothetical protein
LERANPSFRVPGIEIPSPLCMRWKPAILLAVSFAAFDTTRADTLLRDARAELVLGMKPGRDLDLKGVSVHLGTVNEGVRISCARVRVVSKQIGGMKIGIIPELEVTDMTWDAHGQIAESVWAGMVRRFFEREPLMKESRFRGFTLLLRTPKNFRLKSAKACFDGSDGGLELEKPVLELDGRLYGFHRAKLFLDEEQAGKLVLADELGNRLSIKVPFDFLPPEIALLSHTLK